MSARTLELTGTRPPSANSSRPSSASRPRSGYRVVKTSTPVDETLFGSHHPTMTEEVNFKPPWAYSPRVKGLEKEKEKSPKMRPLLWSPEVTADRKHMELIDSIKRSSISTESAKLSKFRPRKHTPSFVDETLFGPRLEEPSFKAPWAEKVKKSKPLYWSPVGGGRSEALDDSMKPQQRYSANGTMDGRPPSRQGRRPISAYGRPYTVDYNTTAEGTKPIWRP